MQLLIIMDAMRRASAERITAVIPYYGYGRQDRKVKPRVPISAKLVADLITTAGANRVVAMDLHAGQIQGYFNIPVDNIFAAPILLKYIQNNTQRGPWSSSLPMPVGLSGHAPLPNGFRHHWPSSTNVRVSPNIAEAMNIIGEVKGKTAIILDDMVDTAGTLTQAARALSERGAIAVHACCTHPILSGPAIERIVDLSH